MNMNHLFHPLRLFALCCLVGVLTAADPVRVCATVPDLGDLVRAVGGDRVTVTVFARGGDDPHFVDPRPSFAKALARADLVVSVGLELEIGWLPVVLTQSRNAALAVGQPGYCEAASAMHPLGIPTSPIDRSHGDVHGGGNPHFLSDPVCGVQVARMLSRRLGELRPDEAATFATRYRTFALLVATRLLGEAVVRRVGDDAAITACESDALATVIGDGADLGGWLGRLKPVAGTRLIADHDLWPYLSQRFALPVVAFLEPKPGVPPTTAHLATVIATAKSQRAKAIITTPYFAPAHAQLVARETGLPVVALAHQGGALPDAPDWLAMVEHNVTALSTALESTR